MEDLELQIDTGQADLEMELDTGQDDLTLERSDPYYSHTESNYERLINKPRINSVELVGNKDLHEIGIQEELPEITNLEILKIFRKY